MGRKKIAIKKISDVRRRQVTFSRRKFGLMKKAYELSVLCNCDVGLFVITKGAEEKLYTYSNKRMDDLMVKYTVMMEETDQAEILEDKELIGLIESSKESLEDYFGSEAAGAGNQSDNDEEEFTPGNSTGRTTKSRSTSKRQRKDVGGLVAAQMDETQSQQPPEGMATFPYYYAAASGAQQGAQGYAPFMPYPYYMYGANMQPPTQMFHTMPHGNPEKNSLPNSAQSSSFHLPPPPFAFAQNIHLNPDGSSSSQSLLQHNSAAGAPGSSSNANGSSNQAGNGTLVNHVGGSGNVNDTNNPGLPSAGSSSSIHNASMFAGGMYYPFSQWPPVFPSLHPSASMGDVTKPLASPAMTAISTRETDIESVKYKESTVLEESKKDEISKISEDAAESSEEASAVENSAALY